MRINYSFSLFSAACLQQAAAQRGCDNCLDLDPPGTLETVNNDISWGELARMQIVKMQDVLLARFTAREEAAKLGFDAADLTRLSTAVSELTRNVVQYAGCPGEMQIFQTAEHDKSGLRIVVSDKGRGVANPEQFLDNAKGGALGAGLPGTRKLVDKLTIESWPGSGTIVTIIIWKRQPANSQASSPPAGIPHRCV